ncbi:hypothetical protein ACFQ67_01215 [Streptomyces sp. NPDC056488]|uniref:hypothetical protein n=1 Tax=unclassified Streptomyces TaxID=2593676 RepID=UPI0036A16CE6
MSTGTPPALSPRASAALWTAWGRRIGIEEQADRITEAACELTTTAVASGWSAAGADDALVATDTFVDALAQVDSDVREVLVATTTTTATVRQRLVSA